MSDVRRIELLGGPFDGVRPALPAGEEILALTDGTRVYVYERGEVFEGPRVREVMRHVQTLPLPRSEAG